MPKDPPFMASASSTVRRAPTSPGRFREDSQAVAEFNQCFAWNDTEHYHSGTDDVTPLQAHPGLQPEVVNQRQLKMLSQRRRRRVKNQNPSPEPTAKDDHLAKNAHSL